MLTNPYELPFYLKRNMNLGLLLLTFYVRDVNAFITPIIETFKYKNINNVVLFHCCNTKCGISLQKKFQKYGIASESFNIDKNISYETTFTYFKVGLYLNTSCKTWESTFATHRSKLKNIFSWIIFTQNLLDTINSLSKYPIEIDSDVTIFIANENKYFFYEIYNTGFYSKENSRVITNIGTWNKKLDMNKNSKRHNFRGLVLKCGVVLMENVPDYMIKHYITVTSRDKVDPLHRFKYFKLFTHLQELYNFSCNLVRTNSWGYQRNSSFDGLVGLLQRREVDIGAAPVFYRTERAEVVDYTAQVWPAKPYIILRQPKYSGSFYSFYTRPLTKTVWLCIFIILTLAGSTLSVLLKMKTLRAEGDEDDASSSFAFLFICGAVSQQGMPINKKSTAVKMVIFITFIFTLTIYQYYNATVVSTLLKIPAKIIDSLTDLVKSDLKAGADDALYNRDFFKRTTDPLAIELYQKKIVHGSHINYLTPEQGMALIKQGGFAFLVDTATAYRIMRKIFSEREVCDATEVSLYPPQSLGSVAVKGTPYTEFLALGTAKMLESGVMQRLKAMWDEPRPLCVRTPDASIFSVNIYEFSMALVILLLGILSSVLMLLCEMGMHRLLRKVDRSRRKKSRKFYEYRH